MTDIRRLEPHDPLPEGHSVVLVRRFAEDDPAGTMLELLVTGRDRREHAEIPVDGDGAPLGLDAAIEEGARRAASEGLSTLWVVDRTAGRREQEVLSRRGDHGFAGDALDDDDLEEGERGPDMRDPDTNAAPRRF